MVAGEVLWEGVAGQFKSLLRWKEILHFFSPPDQFPPALVRGPQERIASLRCQSLHPPPWSTILDSGSAISPSSIIHDPWYLKLGSGSLISPSALWSTILYTGFWILDLTLIHWLLPLIAGPPHTNCPAHWLDLAVGQLCAPSSHPPSPTTQTLRKRILKKYDNYMVSSLPPCTQSDEILVFQMI